MGMEGLAGERTAPLAVAAPTSPVTGRDNEHRDLVLGLLGAKHSQLAVAASTVLL